MGDANAFKHLIGKKLVDNTSKGHEGATAPDANHFLQSTLPASAVACCIPIRSPRWTFVLTA
jgi:hypothetical protein